MSRLNAELVKRNLPNAISVFRIFLSVIFAVLLYRDILHDAAYMNGSAAAVGTHIDIFVAAFFLAILLSDLVDGYLARRMNLATATGAVLDIVSDLVYITGAIGVLIYLGCLPIWFAIVLAVGFAQFAITSRMLSRYHSKKTILVFDNIGKSAAVLTMLLPGIFIFRYLLPYITQITEISTIIITAMFCIATVYRIILVLSAKRQNDTKNQANN